MKGGGIAVNDGLRLDHIARNLLRVGKRRGHVGPRSLRVIVRSGCGRVGGADGGIQGALVNDGDGERDVIGIPGLASASSAAPIVINAQRSIIHFTAIANEINSDGGPCPVISTEQIAGEAANIAIPRDGEGFTNRGG